MGIVVNLRPPARPSTGVKPRQPGDPASTRGCPRLFFEGDELYAAMLESIGAARASVLLKSYL
ncbi:MAG: hypothetical protein ACLGI7_06610, partial [Gammaproteobacteria bacterium]